VIEIAGLAGQTRVTPEWIHNGLRAIGERANALLRTTFKALRHISLDPWCIGAAVAAALALLHLDHARAI
jgi:hypothetical protein